MNETQDILRKVEAYKRLPKGPEKSALRAHLRDWRSASLDRQEDEFSKLFRDDNYFAEVTSDPVIRDGVRNSPFGEALPKRAAIGAFLGHKLGRDVSPLEQDLARDAYAEAQFGKSKVTDEEFFGLVRGEYEWRDKRREAIKDLQVRVAAATLERAASGNEPAGIADVFRQWGEAHPDLRDGKNDLPFLAGALRAQQRLSADMQGIEAPAGRILSGLRDFIEGRETADIPALAREMAALPRDKREKAYGYVSLAAQAGQIDPGGIEQFADNFAKSFTRGFDFLGSGALSDQERNARLWLNTFENGEFHVRDNDDGTVTPIFGPFIGKEGTREATPQERERFRTETEQLIPSFQIARELRNLAQVGVDPINMLADEGILRDIEAGAYGFAGSIPLMAATAVNPLVGAMAYADNEENRIRLENPDMDPGAARNLALVEGFANAAIDRLQLRTLTGRLPVLGRFLEGIKSNGVRRTLKVAGNVVEQNLQEGVQDLIAPLTESIVASVREDMDPKDLAAMLGEYADSRAEVFFAVLPLALIGAGAATMQDIKNPSRERLEADLRRAGFDEKQRGFIMGSESETEAQGRIALEWKNRTPENIEAGKREIEQTVASQPANVTTDGQRFTVRDAAGAVILETEDADAAAIAAAESKRTSELEDLAQVRAMIAFFDADNLDAGRAEGTQTFTVTGESKTLADVAPEEDINRLAERMAIEGIEPGTDLRTVAILGENVGELRNGLFTDTIKLHRGANALTVVHERLDGETKRAIAEGRRSRDWFLKGLRDYEAATGESVVVTDADGNVSDQAIVEGVTKLGEAYFAGRVRDDRLPPGIRAFFRAMVQYFRDVFARAGRLRKAIAEGKVGDDFVEYLADSVGLPMESRIARAAREYQAEMEAEAAAVMRSSAQGSELLDAVRFAGGLPSQKSKFAEQWRGELKNLESAAANVGKGAFSNVDKVRKVNRGANRIFSDDAPDPELVLQSLNEQGFDFFTVDDLFQALDERFSTGREMFGFKTDEAMGFDRSFSIGRAIPSDGADVRYLELAKNPEANREELQRMVDEAAAEAGFTIGPVWHGGADGFTVFDWNRIGEQGTTEGKGFYFSNDRNLAAGYADRHGGRLLKVYLRAGKPLDGKKLTFTKTQVRKVLETVHAQSEREEKGSSPLWNYGDIRYDGLRKVLDKTTSDLMEFSESDVDLLAGLINGGADPQLLYDVVYKVTKKTGIVESDAWGRAGHVVHVATSPNHVKLADPVTYDESGNVIPLSQRFNPEDNRITHSIAPSSKALGMQAALEKLRGDPEGRLAIYERASARLARVLTANQREIDTMRTEGVASAKIDRAKVVNIIAEFEAVLAVLPPKVRGRVGGFKKLAEFKTEKARLRYFSDRIDRINEALEKVLKSEFIERITKTLEKAKPKKGDAGDPRSTLGPEAQDIATAALRASLLDADATAKKTSDLHNALAVAAPGDEAALVQELAIVEMFGDMESLTAAELSESFKWLTETLRDGRAKWRMKEDERIASMREKGSVIVDGLGKASRGGIKNRQNRASSWTQDQWDKLMQFGFSHQAFDGFLRHLLPVNAQGVADDFSKRLRKADNAAQDMEIAATNSLRDVIRSAAKTKGVLAEGRAIHDLKKIHKGKVTAITNGMVTPERIKIKLAEKIVRGEADPGKLKGRDIEALRDELAALPRDSRREYVTIYRVVFPGREEALDMSKADAIQILLSWDQPDVQIKMRREGWTDQSIEQARDLASDPISLAVIDYLRGYYAQARNVVNPVYARMFGMNMPKIRNYAPTRFSHVDDTKDTGPDSLLGISGGKTPGFIKGRVAHSSSLRIVDALTVYHQHVVQQAHWANFAELAREFRGVMKSRDVKEAMEQAHGRPALQVLDMWIEQLESRGGNKAAELAVIQHWLSNLVSAKAVSSLGFNPRTIAMQTDSIGRFIFRMKGKRIAEALTDFQGVMKTVPKAWSSPSVQRRILNGATPEVRYLYEQAAINPNVLNKIAQLSTLPMQFADGALTAFSSAIVYRDAYTQAIKDGAPAKQAEAIATDAMDEAVYRYSQPVGFGSKSMLENSGGAMTRMIMLFMSDPRLKTGILIDAVQGLAQGKGDKADHIRRIIAVYALAMLSQTIANVYRDEFTGDDDDEIWTVEGYAMAALLAPLSGFFLVGAVSQGAISFLFGERFSPPSRDPLQDALERAKRSATNMDDVFNTDDPQAMFKQWENMARTIAIAGPVSAAPATVLNLIKPILGVGENVKNEE